MSRNKNTTKQLVATDLCRGAREACESAHVLAGARGVFVAAEVGR